MVKGKGKLITVVFLLIITFLYLYINKGLGSRDTEKKENMGEGKRLEYFQGDGQAHDKDAGETPIKSPQKEIKVKGVYVNGELAGNGEFMDKLINLINTTELNTVVLDIKEGGKVNYKSHIKSVNDITAYNTLYDVEGVLKRLHENGVYVIGRVVCFRDDYLAKKRPDLAVKNKDDSVWIGSDGVAWSNPYNREVWRYNIDIAKEAVEKGFDEIQFDYVRFPGVDDKRVDYGENLPSKAYIISDFLKTAKEEIKELGVPVSADIFAIVCESPGDTENIGQVLEEIGREIDSISPMIYPSHYANNSRGMMGNGVGQSINGIMFKAPDLEPYKVVYNVLLKTKKRISRVDGYKAKVRPYIQGFTASYLPRGYYQVYGPSQIRQQIEAVYDSGYEEWIIWDATGSYTKAVFLEE